MKLLPTHFAAAVLILLGVTFAHAHEPSPAASAAATAEQQAAASAPNASQPQMTGMPMENSGNSFIGHLKNPDYMHTLLNPMPVYGLSMGVIGLIVGLLFRSRAATLTGLLLIFVSGASAFPVYYFGEQAYDRVKAISDPLGGAWLDEHMARAEKLIYAFYALAALALAGIFAPLKWPRTAFPLAIAALVLGVVNLGIGGWISYAGGHVRHPEFRFEPPPKTEMSEHHHGGEMEHGEQQASPAPAAPAGAQQSPMQHDMPMSPTPQTPEQIEAARMQLEASRMQLEASRKQLEATGASPSATPTPPEHQHEDGKEDHH